MTARSALLAASILGIAGLFVLPGCIVVVGNRTSPAYVTPGYVVADPYRRIGVLLGGMTPALAAQTGAAVDRASVIVGVLPGTPAAEAGLELHDVITHIDGREDAGIASLQRQVADRRAGETVTLRIVRAGKPMDVTVRVEEVAGTRSRQPGSPTPDWRD